MRKQDPWDQLIGLADLPDDVDLHAPAPAASFVDSVRRFGVVQPIICAPLDGATGRYPVTDGKRRVRAARVVVAEMAVAAGQAIAAEADPNKQVAIRHACEAEMLRMGISPMRAVIYPADHPVHRLGAAAMNAQRSENLQTALELIARWKADHPGESEREFARVTCIPRATLRRWAALSKLDPGLRAALTAGQITQNLALVLSRTDAAFQSEAARLLATQGKLTAAEVRGMRRVADAAVMGALPAAVFTTPAPAAPAPGPAPLPPAAGGPDDPPAAGPELDALLAVAKPDRLAHVIDDWLGPTGSGYTNIWDLTALIEGFYAEATAKAAELAV